MYIQDYFSTSSSSWSLVSIITVRLHTEAGDRLFRTERGEKREELNRRIRRFHPLINGSLKQSTSEVPTDR